MVEIIPKKPEREIPFANVSLFVAAALLMALVLGYVVLIRTEAKALNALQDLEDSIAKIGTKKDRDIETKVFYYEKKIKDFAVLLAGRRKSSNFFDNFDVLIHPKVQLSSIELNVIQMQAAVSGQASDFQTLEQQLIFLQRKNDFVEAAGLSDIAIGDKGEAKFDINLDFKPEIFNQ